MEGGEVEGEVEKLRDEVKELVVEVKGKRK